MAVLQLLSHPGVARLISSFRYTASAYMVLEYAAAGDLHSFVLSRGPLRHLTTRFIVGEIAAAVLSLHDRGFSYNDLKPENVLLTEMGHVKIADFGACRAQTKEAEAQLVASAGVLGSLRNGDWRDEVQVANSSATSTSTTAPAVPVPMVLTAQSVVSLANAVKDSTTSVPPATTAPPPAPAAPNAVIDSGDVDIEKLLKGDGR
jgi:serine/threonine protein kinase